MEGRAPVGEREEAIQAVQCRGGRLADRRARRALGPNPHGHEVGQRRARPALDMV